MTGLRRRLRDLWTRLTLVITGVGRRVYLFLHRSAERVADRWDDDGSFRRTVSAAITAVATTAIPHPAISAAIRALLTDRGRRPTSVNRFEDDDNAGPGWPPNPRRLWDSLT